MFGWIWNRKPRWEPTESGNISKVIGDLRVTVFEDEAYGEWKFCLSNKGKDKDPFFSKRYRDKEKCIAAADEVLQAAVTGNPGELYSKLQEFG